MAPDYKADPLHRPKMRKTQLEVLKDVVNFGTSFISSNPYTMNQYKYYEQDQRSNSSLRGHRLLEHIVNMLENDETDKFVQFLWTSEVEGIDERGAALLKMIRYILTSFHLVFSDVPLLTQNHERTPFTENIVPSLLALSKITGFVEFKW